MSKKLFRTLQLAVEFGTFAFVSFAVEFVTLALQFVALVMELDAFAMELGTIALEFPWNLSWL